MLASGSTTISKSCRPGPVERSSRGGANSIPAGASVADRAIPRVQAHPDGPSGDHERLDLPVGSQRGAQTVRVDARNEEVGVLRLSPEQLVAHCSADEVRVERRASARSPRSPSWAIYASAMASISTSAPAGSLPTSTVERAGGVAPMWLA